MELTIIVPTRNRSDLLFCCVKSVLKTNCDKEIEIIVVDDGSRDEDKKKNMELCEKADKIVKNIKIRYFYQNRQFQGAARNKGIIEAKGRLVAFLDDDCEVDKRWISNVMEIFNDKKKQAVFGRILPFETKNTYSVVSNISERHYENKHQKEVYPSLVYNMIIRNSILKKNKLFFDEKIADEAEDIEFNYKLYKKNVVVTFDKDVICKHKYPLSFEEFLQDQLHFRKSRKWRKKYLEDYPYVGWNSNPIYRKLAYFFKFPMISFFYGMRNGVNPFRLMFLSFYQELLFIRLK